MAGSTVKMGVDVTQFKQGMKEAQNSVKTLDAALKYNEKQMKASGNAEKDFTTQANLLNAKLKEQKAIAANAEKALKEMEKNGVRTASAAYQDMQRQLINAQSAILDTEAALNSLNTSQQEASQSAGELSQNVAGIGKKMSLEQVQSGLKSVTGIIEKAATAAWDLGQKLVGSVKDAAKAADDAATMAEMYDIPLTEYLQMQALVESGMDTSVEAILGAMSKMRRGVGADSQATMDALKELGVGMREGNILDPYSWKTKDPTKLFWEAGKAIMALGDAYEQENRAQAIFGKSWRDLKPLFDSFDNQEDYQKALEGTTVNSEDTIRNLAKLNDKMMELEHNFGVVKTELLGALAPALTTVSGVLSDLLVEFNKYLQTPEGQAKLQELGDAVVSLFDGLKDIKPGDVIDTAKSILDGIVETLKWIGNNWQGIVTGIEAIVGAWMALKVTDGMLTIRQLLNGLSGLRNTGDGTNLVTTGGPSVPVTNGGGNAVTTTALTAASGSAATATFGTEMAATLAGGGFSGVAIAALPAVAIAVGTIIERNRQKEKLDEQDAQLAAAAAIEAMGDARTAEFLKKVALATGPERDENGNTVGQGFFIGMNPGDIDGILQSLGDLDAADMDSLMQAVRKYAPNTLGHFTDKMLEKYLAGGSEFDTHEVQGLLENVAKAMRQAAEDGFVPEAYVQPVIEDPEEAAEEISEEIGTVPVLVEPVVSGSVPSSKFPNVGYWWGRRPYGGGSAAGANYIEGYANGLWSVPWDGYPAILHRGERVVPARAAGGTYSSNLYVENMNMNNGTDAAGLAAAMAAAQRRTMSGYGS